MENKSSQVKKDYKKLVLTNRNVYFIRNNFFLLKGLGGFIFVREINRNLAMIESYIKSLDRTIEPSDEYRKIYLKELLDLQIQFADRDEKGGVICDKRKVPVVSVRLLEFSQEVDKLQKKYSNLYEEQQKKEEDFNQHLDDPAPIELYTFSEKQVPSNINSDQYRVILYMIDFSKELIKEE